MSNSRPHLFSHLESKSKWGKQMGRSEVRVCTLTFAELICTEDDLRGFTFVACFLYFWLDVF